MTMLIAKKLVYRWFDSNGTSMGSFSTLTNTYLIKYVASSEFVAINETLYPMRHLVAHKALF